MAQVEKGYFKVGDLGPDWDEEAIQKLNKLLEGIKQHQIKHGFLKPEDKLPVFTTNIREDQSGGS